MAKLSIELEVNPLFMFVTFPWSGSRGFDRIVSDIFVVLLFWTVLPKVPKFVVSLLAVAPS